MLYYLKKYPISLTIILVVIYLSFFKPPSVEIGKIPGIDKVVHICMYAGLSGMLWIEFLRNHRKYDEVLWHAWIGAVLCPILMSGRLNYCRNIVRHIGEATGLTSWQTSQELYWQPYSLISCCAPG